MKMKNKNLKKELIKFELAEDSKNYIEHQELLVNEIRKRKERGTFK